MSDDLDVHDDDDYNDDLSQYWFDSGHMDPIFLASFQTLTTSFWKCPASTIHLNGHYIKTILCPKLNYVSKCLKMIYVPSTLHQAGVK